MAEKRLIGIDIGGTSTKIALLTKDGKIIEKRDIPTPFQDDGSFLSGRVIDTIYALLRSNRLKISSIAGIGLGAPGPVQAEKGYFYEIPNLEWPDRYPAKSLLEQASGLPVRINNDANCAALGEMWRGAGMGASHLVCVTLGTGIGGGVIINGAILQGSRGAAGEIGHVTSVAENGARCNCGKTGCLETVASATGIVRLATERVEARRDSSNKLTSLLKETGVLTAKGIFDLARTGDRTAMEVVEEAAHYLGIALANIANTLNPEKIIIGGGVSNARDLLYDPVKRIYDKHVFPFSASATEITLAQLGNDAGVIGAAWLIKQL
nr:ROK family glucokinase [uncultured Bacillus sp.]